MSGRGYPLLLAAALLLAVAYLASHAPFAFYSPDGSYHAAKLLRAREGEPFVDPFSGTPSIYPSLFHWCYAALGELLRLSSLRLFGVAGALNFLALFAAFLALARTALGTLERAAFAALLLPLLFYAPSGRHILVANPANLGLPLLLAGATLLARSLGGGRAALLGGAALASLAANVVWYLALPAAALLAVRLALDGSWRRPRLVAALLVAALLPCAFTAWHFYSISEGLPAYRGFGGGAAFSVEILGRWLEALFDKGNRRFLALPEHDPLAFAYFYLGVLPFAAFVSFVVARRAAELSRPHATPALRLLAWSGALTLLLSLGLATTGDFPRVVSVQFAGWAMLALVALEWLLQERGALASAARLAAVAVGLAGLLATVRHGGPPFEAEPPPRTRAVIEFLRALPDHARLRVYVSEAHLRELAPFVTFLSFVNHVEGRYHGQDPVSSAELLAAYRAIRERGVGWRAALAAQHVRYLAFRHSDPDDRELGLLYLAEGRAALQNPEWWVVELEAR